MPDRLSYRVTVDGLAPYGNEAVAHHATLRTGDVVDLHLFQRRSRTLGNGLYLLIKRLAEAKGWRLRTTRSALAIWTGRSDLFEIYPGRKIPIAWGTSPSEMSQTELSEFAVDVANVIELELLPTLPAHSADEIRELIGNVMHTS